MTRKTTLVLVLMLALVAGVTTNATAQTSVTADLSWSSQSAFKLFGEVASTRPIGTLDITFEKNGWSAEIIAVRGIGDQNEGEMADYYDGFITWSWESGSFSGTAATEVFHAPAQLGGPHATFISPQATVKWKHNDHFSVQGGAQYVGTYDTDYSGDRVYAWIEPTFSVWWWRLSLDVAPGYIVGETGRTTQYVTPTLSFTLWGEDDDASTLYVSYLEARSWNTGEPGMVPIDATWSFGANLKF